MLAFIARKLVSQTSAWPGGGITKLYRHKSNVWVCTGMSFNPKCNGIYTNSYIA